MHELPFEKHKQNTVTTNKDQGGMWSVYELLE